MLLVSQLSLMCIFTTVEQNDVCTEKTSTGPGSVPAPPEDHRKTERLELCNIFSLVFKSVYLYRAFYNKMISRCFTVRDPEPEPPIYILRIKV